MTLSQYISDFLRDAQNKVAEISVEMNALEDQGSYQYQKLHRSRLELALFMERLYEGKWYIRKGLLTITAVSKANPCVITVSDIGTLAEGDIIYINNVKGMTQLNGNKYSIKNIYQNTFELYNETGTTKIDSTGYNTYTSGGKVTIGWYNHLQIGATSTWTENEVISEIEHLRYYHNINTAPGLSFTGHYLKIASTIVGGGSGSGSSLPAGQYGQLIYYNASNEPQAIAYSDWGGHINTETISDYFTGRIL